MPTCKPSASPGVRGNQHEEAQSRSAWPVAGLGVRGVNGTTLRGSGAVSTNAGPSWRDLRDDRSSDQAVRLAGSLAKTAGHCGAIAFSRTGDPALGDFEDAVILKTVGEVDIALLSV